MALVIPPSEPDAATRIQELWYQDGNVVLLCGNRSFCVHRGVLSSHSSVFRDMFAVPQPDPTSDHIEGCPAVHLLDNSVHLTYLLHALYGRSDELPEHPEHLPEFLGTAAGIISLAHKYDIPSLLKETISRVRRVYPSSFAQLLLIEKENPFIHHARRHGALISIITVARRICPSDLDHILPFAFYLCCQLGADLLVDGVTLPDGCTERLAPEDLKRCITGKERLLEAHQETTLFPLMDTVPSSCLTQTTGCAVERDEHLEDLKTSMMFCRADALYVDRDGWIDQRLITSDLCIPCKQQMKADYTRMRSSVWSQLSTIFDLESNEG
ncbi:hypothetical protein B0H21DRAFT_696691 [Amylocystis lapponica]|nr:hypothetical protein B0H21DRAFT_696691 [Amylocystis lapponica]